MSKQGAINPVTGIPWPAQMTDEWVEEVRKKLASSEDQNKEWLAIQIRNAQLADPPKITKIVTVVDRTLAGNSNNLSGGINIIKVN